MDHLIRDRAEDSEHVTHRDLRRQDALDSQPVELDAAKAWIFDLFGRPLRRVVGGELDFDAGPIDLAAQRVQVTVETHAAAVEEDCV